MSTTINLPHYNIEDNDIYINGKPITENMVINVKKLVNEKYNIDFLIQYGNNINYENVTITVDNVTSVITKLPGEFGEDRRVGKHVLLQILKVNNDTNFAIKFTGELEKTVNVILVDDNGNTDTYLPNLKTTEDVSFYPNGATDYPVSNFDLPMPIVSTMYKIGWLLNNVVTELPTEGLTVNIYYNTELFSITNLGDTPDTRSINDLVLELSQEVINLQDTTIESFTSPMVFEFVNESGIVLSSRSITFVRTNVYLVDEFDRVMSTVYLPTNKDTTINKDYNYFSRFPNGNDLVTPYVTWVNDNVNNGFTNLAKGLIDLRSSDASILTITKKNDFTGYDLRFIYKTIYNSYNVELAIRNITISESWQSLMSREESDTVEFGISSPSVDNSVIKGSKITFNFNASNIAKVEVVKTDTNPDIPFELTYSDVYPISLPHNGKKVYPSLNGTVTFDCTTTVPNNYGFKAIYKDCEDRQLGYSEFTVTVLRPRAEITSDFNTTKLNVDIDTTVTLNVRCKNVFIASIVEPSFDNMTVAIENIQHSNDLLESGTYETYTFDIKITPTKVGVAGFTLKLADDQDDATLTYTKTIDVFTDNYTPVKPNGVVTDIYRGHNPRHSYTKKYKYQLPLAFVDNGDVGDYLLVAKYPISQTDNIGQNYSKAFRSRLQLIKGNKIDGAPIGNEGGEYYSIVSKTFDKEIVQSLKDNNALNNKAVPVVNSIHLDQMLANLTDVSYFGILENNKDDLESNYFVHYKGLNYNTNGFSPYPENTLTSGNTNGGLWNIYANTRQIDTYYGIEDKELDKTLNSDTYYLLPMITNHTHLTHNGQSNGIVDPFNIGVKVYHDVKVNYHPDNGYSMSMVDPYESTQSNTDSRTFKTLGFEQGRFLASVSKAYIQPNDYPANAKSTVYGGAEYFRDNDIGLLDSAGIPYDNMIKSFKEDVSFKGNKGFRESLLTHRYGDSIWCNDVDKIAALNKEVELCYVSGGTFDKSLIKVWDTANSNPDHIKNRYPEYLNTMEMGYRNRLLLDTSVAYNVNKDTGKSDQIFYNYRVSFLVFDKGIKDRAKLKVTSEWLLMEKFKSYPFTIETDGDASFVNNDKITIDPAARTVTAGDVGEGSLTITASKEGKENNTRTIEYKIVNAITI